MPGLAHEPVWGECRRDSDPSIKNSAKMTHPTIRFSILRAMLVSLMLLGMAACATPPSDSAGPRATVGQTMSLLPQRQELALFEAQSKRARGQRVWCVPFARDLSGVELRGNAGTWWGQARGLYPRGKQPRVGAVMAFASTGKLPMGHVAVVSDVVSDRQVRIDHANWQRNKVTLRQNVVDISPANDWSLVRVESVPGTLGRPYPVNGFIYNNR